MAAAAEKFRGLSKGLLPAVGTESGDKGLERVGEGVPTTRLLRLPLRQLQGCCRPSDGLHGLHGLPGLNRHGLWLLGDRSSVSAGISNFSLRDFMAAPREPTPGGTRHEQTRWDYGLRDARTGGRRGRGLRAGLRVTGRDQERDKKCQCVSEC